MQSSRIIRALNKWNQFVGQADPKFASKAFLAYLDMCGLTITEKKE